MQVKERFLNTADKCLFPVCPRCNIPFEHEYQKFCRYCGQKLKWTYYSKAKISLPEGFRFADDEDEEEDEDEIYENPYTHFN